VNIYVDIMFPNILSNECVRCNYTLLYNTLYLPIHFTIEKNNKKMIIFYLHNNATTKIYNFQSPNSNRILKMKEKIWYLWRVLLRPLNVMMICANL